MKTIEKKATQNSQEPTFRIPWIEANHWPVSLFFFAIFFIVGLLVFKDYGIPYDEEQQRIIGLTAYEYVFEGNNDFLAFIDRDYGIAFELPLIILEKAFNLTDTRTVFLMRHFMIFLFFFVSVIFFFFLCRHHFGSYTLALIGSLFLIITPRIFAHSFYNSKDMPFLSMIIISLFSFSKLLENKNLFRTAFHALICALLVNLRIIGIMIFIYTLIYLCADFIKKDQSRKQIQKKINLIVIYIICSTIFTILFWPYLWTDPVGNFIETFKSMSKFEYQIPILYLGEMISGKNLPWHYLPLYIIVTTPILYTLFFIVGLSSFVANFLRSPLKYIKNDLQQGRTIFLLSFFGPISAIIALNSTLYDGWRHMYFIYPSFIFISLTGVNSTYRFVKAKLETKYATIPEKTISLVILANLFFLIVSMAAIHPYEFLFFNNLIKKEPEYLRNQFEMDYWGLTYKEGLEYILSVDDSPSITVKGENDAININSYILTKKQRGRIKLVGDLKDAKYYLGNYRFRKKKYFSNIKPNHRIRVMNTTIMDIFKKPE